MNTPAWLKDLENKFAAKAAHTFLLNLNIADLVLTQDGQLEALGEHLVSEKPVANATFIAFFNRGTGIQFPTPEAEKKFLKFLALHFPILDPGTGQNITEQYFMRHRTEVVYMLQVFSDFLELSHSSEDKMLKEHLADVFPDVKFPKDKPFSAAGIEYTETLAPPGSGEGDPPDRNALVPFLVWARSKRIERAGNIIVFIAESTASVAQAMRSKTNNIIPIELPFPDIKERELVFSGLIKEHEGRIRVEVDRKTLGRISAGMTRRGIAQPLHESAHLGLPITDRRVFEEKKRLIELLSGGLLEVKRPMWGREVIGGLDEHKRYIGEIINAMVSGDILAVPMGIMLLGAPGTGKTVFAEALAYEAGIQMLVMKNTRNMWVGSSERNLDFSLKLITAHEPALVFVDEIDQQYQARSSVGDNTGVNQRMQAALFEFMSDTTYRGRVLWIAASNRPDLLDDAMKRPGRFDEKIPFFPPSAEERALIVPALITKFGIQAREAGLRFESCVDPKFFDEFGWSLHRHIKAGKGLDLCDLELHTKKRGNEADDEVGFTGAEIETIIRKAYVLASTAGVPMKEDHLRHTAEEYIPTRNVAMYNWMTDLALLECNSERFMPDRWKKRARLIRGQRSQSPSSSGMSVSDL